MNPHTTVSDPLRLPCGAVVKNRILKGAMSEGLGDREHAPRPELAALYARWARGGSGVVVTGNVMVDARALGEPGNVVLQDGRHLAAFHAWAVQGSREGAALWMQLNHPGKQAPRGLNPGGTVAPSAVGFGRGLSRAFAVPRALSVPEIHALSARFAAAAALAQRAGFGGVQLHAAHGYLLSQFLSPRHNVREDEYGGSLEGRMRFLLETFRAVRAAVGPGFPVSVKLNSSDFTRGGFSEDDSLGVVRALAEAGCDLIEVSGGTYEKPMMMTGRGTDEGAYFADFGRRARAFGAPICVTGGFRDSKAVARALAEGHADLVGLGRPLALDPDFAARLLAGLADIRLRPPARSRALAGFSDIMWYEDAIRRHARGETVRAGEPGVFAAARILRDVGLRAATMRRRA